MEASRNNEKLSPKKLLTQSADEIPVILGPQFDNRGRSGGGKHMDQGDIDQFRSGVTKVNKREFTKESILGLIYTQKYSLEIPL